MYKGNVYLEELFKAKEEIEAGTNGLDGIMSITKAVFTRDNSYILNHVDTIEDYAKALKNDVEVLLDIIDDIYEQLYREKTSDDWIDDDGNLHSWDEEWDGESW